MKPTLVKTDTKRDMPEPRLTFQEMMEPSDPTKDEWAVINNHEQRLNRLEKILKELKERLSLENHIK